MTHLTSLLVGMHFRPPAKTLLASLPAGTRLRLEAEPGNPYDENAIAVLLDSAELPESQHPTLEQALPANGSSLEEVLAQRWWHLGYVAASGGKPLLGTNYSGNADWLPHLASNSWANLGFDEQGRAVLLLALQD